MAGTHTRPTPKRTVAVHLCEPLGFVTGARLVWAAASCWWGAFQGRASESDSHPPAERKWTTMLRYASPRCMPSPSPDVFRRTRATVMPFWRPGSFAASRSHMSPHNRWHQSELFSLCPRVWLLRGCFTCMCEPRFVVSSRVCVATRFFGGETRSRASSAECSNRIFISPAAPRSPPTCIRSSFSPSSIHTANHTMQVEKIRS